MAKKLSWDSVVAVDSGGVRSRPRVSSGIKGC